MRLVLGLLFLGACFAYVFYRSGEILLYWSAITTPELISFDKNDTKLFVVLGVVVLAGLSWFVWPESFAPQPETSWKQCLTLGAAVSGMLAGFNVLVAANYLAAAEQRAVARGYVRCSSDTDLRFGDLEMARSKASCPVDTA